MAKRKFQIGDSVTIKKDTSKKVYKIGSYVSPYYRLDVRGILYTWLRAEQLEAYKPKPKTKFKEGDEVIIVQDNSAHGLVKGTIVIISSVKPNNYLAYVKGSLHRSRYIQDSDGELKQTSIKQPMTEFQICDRLEIVANTSLHGFDIGDIVEVVESDISINRYKAVKEGDGTFWYINFEDAKLINKSEKEEEVKVSRSFLQLAYKSANDKQKHFISTLIKGQSPLDDFFAIPKKEAQKGYKMACDEWKKKIEKEIPDLIKTKISLVQKTIEKLGVNVYSNYSVTIEKDLVIIPLPANNQNWTKAAFTWAINFVDYYNKEAGGYDSFVDHTHKNSKEIAIRIYKSHKVDK